MAGAAYFATGAEALLFAAFVQHLIVLQQLMPLLRFDGYYVLSDLTGVPDILSRVKPIFRSLIRGRRKEPRVAELKPWVRIAVTAYLVVLVPLLTFMIGSIVLSAPRTFATAYDSFWLQLDRLQESHGTAELGVGAFRIAALVMPLAAMSLSLSRTLRMATKGIAHWSRGSVVRRCIAVAGVVTVAVATAFIWWPNGDYQPIRPGEKGTVGEAISSVPAVASGRPSFTPEREQRFGTEQTVRERAATAAGLRDGDRRGPLDRGAEPQSPGAKQDFDDGGSVPGDADPASDPGDSGSAPASGQDGTDATSPAGTSAPTSGSAPAPSGTSSPAPTATATPTPTSTATPAPTASVTPTETPASSPDGTALATPSPEATAPASPTPDLQAPTAEPTPIPTP
jgi:putative peptide zinc metalloprotease protein